MKYIAHRDDLVPASLEDAKKKNVPWDDFSRSEDGRFLRQNKAKEQGGLCCYCECRLETEAEGMLLPGACQVEHFLPRHKGANPRPDLTYCWDNMVLSCMHECHCGVFKDRSKVPPTDIINPRKEDPREQITFVLDSAGRHFRVFAEARAGTEGQRARDTIKALGLNHEDLVELRGGAWYLYVDAVADLLACQEPPDNELVQVLLEEMEQGEFPSAMVALAKASL